MFDYLVTGRHESGSYYTPRPIVAFMCREALKSHLAPVEADAAAIARFVDDDDAGGLADPERVLELLKRIKVCDPACGSGAYLLGMMKELMRLRDTLFVTHRIDAVSTYNKKLDIIQNNLYGVDIDRFAVNIAMLRLWLSLVIEYEGSKPPPLPNLGYKIACADSLTAPDPSALVLQSDAYDKEAARLGRLHDEIFYLGARRHEKKTTRTKLQIDSDISASQKEIADLFGDSVPAGALDWRAVFAEVFARREAQSTIGGALNLGQELSEAAEPGGFDVVLANPPYVRMELFKDAKPVLRQNFPHVHSDRADLYVYFYARALQLLKPRGILVFISSNKWFRAGYGGKLRKHIANTTKVLSITDFGNLPVFQEADAYPMIFIAQKDTGEADATDERVEITRWTQVKSLDEPYPDVKAIVARDGQLLPAEAITGAEWTLTDAANAKRLQQMRMNGIPLGEYVHDQIYRGVVTGLNSAFVIDSVKRAELIQQDAKSAEIIKPLAIGRDIKRWSMDGFVAQIPAKSSSTGLSLSLDGVALRHPQQCHAVEGTTA